MARDFKQAIIGNEIRQRIRWFISLRWVAVVALFFVITFVRYALHMDLPFPYLYAGNAVLAFFNFLFVLFSRRLSREKDRQQWFQKANYFANLQIFLDLFVLTYLLHFSGSIENPFILYFIFHIIIASVLLDNRAAYLQATAAIVLLGLTGLAEYSGSLPHYHLSGFISPEEISNPLYLAGVFFVFATTMYLTVYMATSIVNRLREREVALAAANEKIIEQDRLKSHYVATVSHDLQASLAAIQNCLKVVLDGLAGPIPEKSHEMVRRAEQRTFHLLNFVKELLDLSRIRASKELERKECNLAELVRDVVSQVKPRADEKDISLETEIQDSMPLFLGNADAIEKLFMNLLTNGIRYTPAGGTVGVRLGCVAGKNGCFQAEVWDTGIGIAETDRPRIFDEFYRAKNARLIEKEGTGLGLSIAKEVVKAHAGEIRVESEAGKGTKFLFTLSGHL